MLHLITELEIWNNLIIVVQLVLLFDRSINVYYMMLMLWKCHQGYRIFIFFIFFYLEVEKRRRCAKERHTALRKRSLLQLCQLKSSLTRLASKTSQNRARSNKIKKSLYFRREGQEKLGPPGLKYLFYLWVDNSTNGKYINYIFIFSLHLNTHVPKRDTLTSEAIPTLNFPHIPSVMHRERIFMVSASGCT